MYIDRCVIFSGWVGKGLRLDFAVGFYIGWTFYLDSM